MINYVMLTWNRKAFLQDLFNSFYKNVSSRDYHFYIIDNGSNDGTQEYLKELSEKDHKLEIVYNDQNNGLEEYKKLLKKASSEKDGEYIIIIDDDVLEFPKDFDQKLVRAMEVYNEIGFLALDVVQDDKTNGAKPTLDSYIDETRKGITIQKGPAGGWCAIMRVKDYKKIKFLVNLRRFDMSSGEDSNIVWFFRKILRKGPGVLKNETCLHASGPYYSREYGYLERDIEKYEKSGLHDLKNIYISYRDE